MMIAHWHSIFFFIVTVHGHGNHTLLSYARSGYLEKYLSYLNAIPLHFDVPNDVSHASFQFRGCEQRYSIFSCDSKEIELYLKHGGLPVINPDGSEFPKDYMLKGRAFKNYLNFTNNKTVVYVNITDPLPGSYYAVMFYPYTDPKEEGIVQEGLTPKCNTFVDASLYVEFFEKLAYLTPTIETKTVIRTNTNDVFKVYVPPDVDRILVRFYEIKFCDNCVKLIASLRKLSNSLAINRTLSFASIENLRNASVDFWVEEKNDYYLRFYVETLKGQDEILAKIKFDASFLNASKHESNGSIAFPGAKDRALWMEPFPLETPYKHYVLHKSSTAESFLFTYEMQPLQNGTVPMTINVINEGFSVLKFHVRDVLDIGGSLQVSLAFKSRITQTGRRIFLQKEPVNNTIVACIRNGQIGVPIWKEKCHYQDKSFPATLILNETTSNASVIIPYPEAGDWYVSFKLFCTECESCSCSKKSIDKIKSCIDSCHSECFGDNCEKCRSICEESLIKDVAHEGCDCDANCLKSDKECNTSILFDVSSYPCAGQRCGSNGKCALFMSEALVYSSCDCTNNYRGWDCSDGSQANSMGTLLLEMLLLVLSNAVFIPAAYVAYRRRYYVEMIVYSSTCFFSSIYHACDAGENIISFCITRLSVLQFCDFYCALMSIWVTLVALAHLDQPRPQMLHILGAIIIAAGTTLNKTSMWVFLLPATVGVAIMISSWGIKYYRTRHIFPSKRYLKFHLPAGILTVALALLLYSLLQTKNNYKYVHSIWHVLMAISLIVLLPNKKSFLPISDYL